jgi:hypothetical protein
MRALQYLFYRLYRWSAGWESDVTPPEVTAFLGVVVVVWCSAFLALEVGDLVLGGDILPSFSKLQVVTSAAVLAVPLYFLLLHRRRYQKIVREFEFESPHSRRIRGVIVFAYIVVLFLGGIGGAILHARVGH